MFKGCNNTGVHVSFKNKWTVSIQWGKFNYCNNYPRENTTKESPNAEIAVFTPSNEFLPLDGDSVEGWVSPETVAEILFHVSKWREDISIDTASEVIIAILKEGKKERKDD